ncbi:MAG: leucyl aminopeptidase [candidate division Zixibacteria bacterium]|nr:leucyl aminopeptidase [candidate division Zixibacteria bacterium]
MQLRFDTAGLKDIATSSLVIFCPEAPVERVSSLKELDRILDGGIGKVYASGEFEGKPGQTAVVHTLTRMPAERVILAGLGEKKKIDHETYRRSAGVLSRLTAVRKSATVAFYFDADASAEIAQAVVEGFILGQYRFTQFKSSDNNNESTGSLLLCTGAKTGINKLTRGAERGLIIAEGVVLARDLSGTPANVLTPRKFASQATALAKMHGFACTVLDEKQIKAERMNCLLGVANGSTEPPRFLVLKYAGTTEGKPIVLVGKGITFDAGGISLKPGLDMHHMRSDMTGAGCVLAAIVTAARLGLKRNVVGLLPLAENLPSGTALKPGDVLTSRKGKTVEIINTDAEGRLILIDALDYANEFDPQAVIDIATLTGGAMYITGYAAALLMGNNDKLKASIREASDATGERVWPMPIWDDYRDWMKSPVADLKNSGGKPATSCTAAAFLEVGGVGDWPWAHIDIASVDLEESGKPYIPKGYTAFGMRLLVELLSQWKKV